MDGIVSRNDLFNGINMVKPALKLIAEKQREALKNKYK